MHNLLQATVIANEAEEMVLQKLGNEIYRIAVGHSASYCVKLIYVHQTKMVSWKCFPIINGR